MAATVPNFAQIVQYSDSSEDEEGETEVLKVKKKEVHTKRRGSSTTVSEEESKSLKSKKSRLELPSALLTMFKDESKPQDDPSQHGGRTRSFAHERGNWATFVYIPVQNDEDMARLTTDLLGVLPTPTAGWTVFKDLHLSLSRTVVVYHHWIDELVSALRLALPTIHVPHCSMGEVQLYTNDDKTRTFVGLRVNSSYSELKGLVSIVDKCFAEFQLEQYYKDPSFHVSIAWTLGDVTGEVTEEQRVQLQNIFADHIFHHPDLGVLDTTSVEAKCGNKVFSFTTAGT